MDLGIFSIVVLALLAVCLLLSLIKGLLRGVIRSFVRLIIVLICAVASIYLAQPIAAMLLDMDITSWNLSFGDGVVVEGSLQDFIMNMLLEMEGIGEFLEMAPSLVSVLEQIPAALVSIVVFLLLFFVLKLVSLIPYCIIKIFIPRRNADGTKKRKHRFCGFLVSILQTVVVMSVLLIPTVGVINTVEQLAPAIDEMMNEMEEGEGENAGALQTAIGDITEKDMVYGFLKSTGLKDFYVVCFNKLTNIKLGSVSASLFDELIKLMELASSMGNMMSPEGAPTVSGFTEVLNKATESELAMQTLSEIIITNSATLAEGGTVDFAGTSISIESMVGEDEEAKEMLQDFFGSFTEDNESQVEAGVVALSNALNAASEYTKTHHGVSDDGEISAEEIDSFETVIGDLAAAQDSYLEDIRNGVDPDPEEEALMRDVYGAIYDSGVLKEMVPPDIVESLGLGSSN